IDSRAVVNINQGFDIRLTNEEIADKLGRMRVKRIHFAWDNPQQDLTEYFRQFAAAYRRKASSTKVVYILVNFNSTMEENLHRIYTVRDLGYDPYVMVYDKPNAPAEIKQLQRWVNNKFVFRKCERFEEYRTGGTK
ncbi:MAG: radical SAM protein, partial [Faecousia sp.]